MTTHALVLAPPPGAKRRIVTGLTLGERARRVAVRAGFADGHIHVVATHEEMTRAAAAIGKDPVLLLRAVDQLVAGELAAPLAPEAPGTRVAWDPARSEYAGGLRADGERATELLTALCVELDDRPVAARWLLPDDDTSRVEVGPRARHPAGSDQEARAADAWQFELTKKALDGFLVKHMWRPLARPLTRFFLRTPLTPNHISILSCLVSVAGCVIAGGPSYRAHLGGMALLFLGSVMDANDGEVARLRLEMSKLGAWIDAIGDDIVRLTTLGGIAWHVRYLHPGWHVGPITWIALAATLASMLLIYWYCIFVIGSSNNQDYGAVLGIGPGQGKDRKSIGQIVGDLGAQAARREVIDLVVLILALVALPELSWIGLVAGGIIGLVVILPTHLKIVKLKRAGHKFR